jgi:hypothetical protein
VFRKGEREEVGLTGFWRSVAWQRGELELSGLEKWIKKCSRWGPQGRHFLLVFLFSSEFPPKRKEQLPRSEMNDSLMNI